MEHWCDIGEQPASTHHPVHAYEIWENPRGGFWTDAQE